MNVSTTQKIQQDIYDLLWDNHFNWDGANGLPMREDVHALVSEIFGSPTLKERMRIDDCEKPYVALNAAGSVVMTFGPSDNTFKRLLLTFQCYRIITYIKVLEDGETSIEGVIRKYRRDKNEDEFAELVELTNWISEE